MELKNKVAIVAGGSQGIGSATALRLAKEGARVVIAARGRELPDQVALEIRAAGSASPTISESTMGYHARRPPYLFILE